MEPGRRGPPSGRRQPAPGMPVAKRSRSRGFFGREQGDQLFHQGVAMGATEKLAFLDQAVWAGKVFTGAWVQAAGGARDVVEPATGKVMAGVGIANADDVALAAAAAAQAQ